jgi:zinc transport system substrate-binding protein
MGCAVLLMAACGPEAGRDTAERSAAPAAGPLVVYAVNYPLAYFAERIGGDAVQVEFPIPSDTDPAFWAPDAEAVAAFQEADLILLNGAGYASWVPKTSLPASKLVNTSAAFEDMYIVMEEEVVHTHGPEGEHEHANVAFTTWLDPLLAIEQARAIREAMTAGRPDQEAVFSENFAAVEGDLTEIDSRLETWAERWSGTPVLGSHPVYQYLARRYELDMRSVHFEPDQVPSPTAWRDLGEIARQHGAPWMLWEGPPSEEIRARLEADYGIATAVFDPSGNRPDSGDYLSVMRANVEALEALEAF